MIATIGSLVPQQLQTDTQRPDVRTLAGDLVKLVIQVKIFEGRIEALKNRIGTDEVAEAGDITSEAQNTLEEKAEQS